MTRVPAELAEDEIYLAWRAVLRGHHREGAGHRFDCPSCGKDRRLSVQAKPGKRHPEWNPVGCGCDRDDVGAKLAGLGLISSARRARKSAPDPGEVLDLILDKSLPPNALRVAVLRAYGMNAAEIRKRLGLPRSTYYDTVRILGRNRRSALVRILGLLRICKISPSPQVSGHLTRS